MSRLKDQTIAETEGYVTEEPAVEQESNTVKSEAVLSKLGELVNKALDDVKKDVNTNANDIKELQAADERLRSNIDGLAEKYAELKTEFDSVDFDEEQKTAVRKAVSDAIAKASNEEVKKLQMDQAGLDNKVDTLVERMKTYEEAQAQLTQLVSEIQGRQEELAMRLDKLETVPVPEPTPVVVEPAPTPAPAPEPELKEPEKPCLYDRLHPKKAEPKEILPFYVAINADGKEVMNEDGERFIEEIANIAIAKANTFENKEHRAKEVYFWVDENGKRLFQVAGNDLSKF